MPKPDDLYGTYGGVPTSTPAETGSGAQPINVHADANAFGGQIGAAEQKIGGTLTEVGAHASAVANDFLQKATEAKVNDDYANKYVPAAASLRNQYDQLEGQDKISGYNDYISGLQALNHQFTGSMPGPYGQQLMSGLIDRHIAGEVDGAKRELVTSQIDFSHQAAADKLEADIGLTARNYNDPTAVDQGMKTVAANVVLQHDAQGYDLSDATHHDIINSAIDNAQGQTAVAMINHATANGNTPAAYAIREKYGPFIPADKQLVIDRNLHFQAVQQTAINSVQALNNGQPLPPQIGAPAVQVQATVADAAHNAGIDPNLALSVLRIESSDGQNLGKRGTIGQTGPVVSLPEQALNMISKLKEAQSTAAQALGRPPTPSEVYTCYQQGIGGGPALLKASINNSSAKAVDVLMPLYKNPQDARDAIVKNGGNVTMTSGDYLKFINQKYGDNAARAFCDFSKVPAGTSPGQSILDPHIQQGEVVQPAATPQQALDNFNEKIPQMMDRLNAMPNAVQRQGILSKLEQHRKQLQLSVDGYNDSQVSSAHKLGSDPSFTSTDQIPPEMFPMLAEKPAMMTYLTKAAEENSEKATGINSKDAKTYGAPIIRIQHDIASGKITNAGQLVQYLPQNENDKGDFLTVSGFAKANEMLSMAKKDEGALKIQTAAIDSVKAKYSAVGKNDIEDPAGQVAYYNALPLMYKAWDEGLAKGYTPYEMADPESSRWIGLATKATWLSDTQKTINALKANPSGLAPSVPRGSDAANTPIGGHDDLEQAYKTETDPVKKKSAGQSLSFVLVNEYKNTSDPDKKELIKQRIIDLGLAR